MKKQRQTTNDRFRLMYMKLKQIKRTWLTRFDSPFALILLLPVFVNIFQTITKYVCQCLVRDYVIMLGGSWGRSLMHKELCLLKKGNCC